jgi:peptide subunit release factor 1 (eRF1)
VAVKQAVKRLVDTTETRGLTREVAGTLRADLERIVTWLADPANLPAAHGVALFVSGPLDLFEVIPLMRVLRTRIDVDVHPLLYELLGVQETLESYLAVAVDRSHARFFVVRAAGAEELDAIRPVRWPGGKFHGDRRDSPGWGERDYHRRIEAEKHRHYAAVAQHLDRLVAVHSAAGIAILGAAETVKALQPFLTSRRGAPLLGTARVNPTVTTPAQVHELTWKLQRESERHDEAALVNEVETRVNTGWAVNGKRETLRALGHGQVHTLLIPREEYGQGFRCSESGRLMLVPNECRGEGEATPVPNLIDEVIEEALQQRVRVVVIDDPVLLAGIDGLAGLLRFRTP